MHTATMSVPRWDGYLAYWKKETVKLKYNKVTVTNFTISR